MAGQEPRRMSENAACEGECPQASGRSRWWMVLPLIGVGLCCGGPVLGAWLVSAGILAGLGTWWAGTAPWIVGGAAVVSGGVGLVVWRRGQLGMAERRFES